MSGAVDRAEAYRIFSAALDLEEAARDAFVQQRCGANAELLKEVAALLAVATDTNATGVLLGAPERPLRDLRGQEYGRFRLVELIGAGGMGVVYRAERTDGVPQAVAVKLLRGEISAASSARFVSEARILARLEHPAIARLIDVGVRDGEGWIALELVRGRPIDEYCDAHRLEVRERVRLLAVVADAVAVAHRNLVVHRDLKPTNVLVTSDGQPRLIDFGIASALSDGSEAREPTADIRSLFTPNYAAPEQVRGDPVTVATDIFGLGALAYRVLSGRMLFADATSTVGYLLAVLQQEPLPPSRAAQEPRLAQQLRGDLDAIVLKALERDPSRRYASATEFRADLERHLAGLPVAAHAPSAGYRLVKFVRRRALASGLAALLLAGLIASVTVYLVQARSVTLARTAAARRGEFLENLLRSADPNNGSRDITVAALLDAAAGNLDQQFSGEPLVEASMFGLIAQTDTGLGRYQQGHAANERQIALLQRYGGRPLDIAQALLLRGQLYRGDGKWQPSELALRDAVARLRRLDSPTDLCLALDNLAVALLQTQRESEAEALFREEIAIESRGNEALRNQRMNPYHDLSLMLGSDLGRYAEAEVFARQAWQLAQQILPPDHPDRDIMESAYGSTLMNTGQAAAAEPLIRQAIAHMTRVLGATHHDTLVSQLFLEEDLMALHRDAEAAAIAQLVGEQMGAQLGADNQYTLMAQYDYGTAECRLHEDAKGLAMLRSVSDRRRRLLPPGHRYLYATDTSLGVCLDHLHRYDEAEPLLLGAAEGLTELRGSAHHRTQEAYQALQQLYLDMNRPAAAARWAAKLQSGPPNR
ncbi:MAG TPA: protein kinase [Steroidobacteraceae bacterium]|nr:protein kinase [Steroidobacteraceae bacterium]